MINRTLIRLKIVQLMYAYYQNSGKSIDTAEKELLFSLAKAYDLYNYMLLLMVSVSRYAIQDVEHKEQLNKVGHIDEEVSHRFADNRFTAQLEINKQLMDFVETKKKSWNNDLDYVKKLYADIVQSEYYTEYMAMEEVTYADHVYVMDAGQVVMEGTPREIFAQAERLKELRLSVPQVTELAYELKKAGADLPDGVLTIDELVDALAPRSEQYADRA